VTFPPLDSCCLWRSRTSRRKAYDAHPYLRHMLVIHATVPVDPESREEAVEEACSVAEESRKEEGVIDYHVAVDAEDENLLRFFEQYEDEAAFGAHASSEHFGEFASKLPGFLNGEPVLTQFEVTDASEVEL